MLKVQDRYYTLDQVAERFQVSRRTVNRWIEQGQLVAVKFERTVRVSESAVQDFVRQHTKDRTEGR